MASWFSGQNNGLRLESVFERSLDKSSAGRGVLAFADSGLTLPYLWGVVGLGFCARDLGSLGVQDLGPESLGFS